MTTIPTINEQFASEIGDARRMLAVEFGGGASASSRPIWNAKPATVNLTHPGSA
jgi:hypothetical protein